MESTTTGVPSNAELAQRMARVEETVGNSQDILERIERGLNEDVDDLNQRVSNVEPSARRFDLLWRGGKWVSGLLLGGGVLGNALGLF